MIGGLVKVPTTPTKNLVEKFQKVVLSWAEIRMVNGKYNIREAVREIGWEYRHFLRARDLYSELDTFAKEFGVTEEIATESDAFMEFVSEYSQEWTPLRKTEACKKICDALRVGLPVSEACASASVEEVKVQAWCKETPALMLAFRESEAEYSRKLLANLNISAKKAAERGKYRELLEGMRLRFPANYAQPHLAIPEPDLPSLAEHVSKESFDLSVLSDDQLLELADKAKYNGKATITTSKE